jgi:asparagine N-glycosylation enzyme membrane subunit Stt3
LAEGSENPSRSFLSKLNRRDGRPGAFRKWMNANWGACVMLLFIFLLALFVRSYFAYDLSSQNGYAVSGGSDSYYWKRIIDYSGDTGKQLFWDPLTAYPDGIRNPRPPLYSMSVVVPSVIAQGLFDSFDDAIGFTFIWSTAFWGALTVIPTYFLGKEIFGRRVGLVAAFFLAVMPSHVQRSVLSNADHDAIILFFIVLTFYFLLKSVKNQQQKRWVENWRSPASIKTGLGTYFRESRTSILYALMAGTAFASVIMTWVGFAYVAVIILVYFLIQVLFNKFRNIDSMSVMLLIFITMSFGYLISYPVYAEQALIVTRFDVPVYLFLAAMLFGGLFVISRDFPWTIVIPSVMGVVIVGVFAISIINPALGEAILSGQGYFVKSKLYSTIAEARAPVFSELALSFGMVTFFMSLAGLVWAIVKMPKRVNADYIFIVVWMGAAIFMAISAGRFMFNAAPAFAVAAAWVLVIIVDRLDFNSVRKLLVGGSGSPFQILKKSIKLRHVVGALFLAFMVVVPNVYYSIDAGIPSETKQKYDLQIYNSLPSFMRQSNYDVNGTSWYLGAFGYQLPLPGYYFPAAWTWFAQQDNESAPVDRPAFVAWWDYGFEAIQEGQHPTVADNFQNGYQLTGNALMAQSEGDAIAIFAFRLIQAAYEHQDLRTKMDALFDKYGVSKAEMSDILTGPGQPLIDLVLSDSIIYGPMSSDLSDANARIVAGRVELSKIGIDKLVSLYGEICDETGWDISYFMVDSRMLPLAGSSTGIFYAPAKLSDRRLTDGSTPMDFYEVKAVLSDGTVKSLNELMSTDTITDYTIAYKDMFFDSMFYRAMVGYSPSDIGLDDSSGLPGWSSSMYSYSPMPGWNLTHFKMVYRTVYYNPWPTSEISQHSKDWTAMNVVDAVAISNEIDKGTANGYVDKSASSYYQAGAVFLKYYPGAMVSGTLKTQEGYPIPGVNVTVSDEFGIPHGITTTDANGSYSLVATAGNLTLTFSAGSSQNINLYGSSRFATISLNVTEDQAMRQPYDLDGNGILDYYITEDIVIKGAHITGDIFWDNDLDGNYTSVDSIITGGTVYATDVNFGYVYSLDASSGSIDGYLAPGGYDMSATVLGRNITAASQINVTYGETATVANLALVPGSINGTLFNADGTVAGGIEITLTALPYGNQRNVTTEENGSFAFQDLLEGRYSLTTIAPGKVIYATEVELSQGQDAMLNATISTSTTLTYRVVKNGIPVPYSVYSISNYYDPSKTISGIVDNFGKIQEVVPEGLWTVYATYYTGTDRYAGAVTVSTYEKSSVSGSLELVAATQVTGVLRNPQNSAVQSTWMCFEDSAGARIWLMTDELGAFAISLAEDDYAVTSQSPDVSGVFSGQYTIKGKMANIQLKMQSGAVISGTLWALKDSNLLPDADSLASYGELKYVDGNGHMISTIASEDGSYEMVFPVDVQVAIGLGNPGYTDWVKNATFDSSTSNVGLIAYPDHREVTGYVTYNGVGLRNVQVQFLPDASLATAYYATTGAGGFYSVLVAPSNYSVVIDQVTGPSGGEKYLSTSTQVILPADTPEMINIQPVKKVEMTGRVTGAGTNVQIKLEGPEDKTVTTTDLEYSTYVLPGTYTVYATGSLGTVQYANITSVDVSITQTEHDFLLSMAGTLSGTIKINDVSVKKPVAITAESSTGPVVHSQSTSNGAYSLALPSGSYTVSFLVEDMLSQGAQKLYVEYYEHAAITMASSDQYLNPNLDVRMDNSTLSGTVRSPDGTPVQAVVELISTGTYGQSVTFTTGSSGGFEQGVQPGDYTARVTRSQDSRIAILQISVTRNVPLDIDIALVDGRTVSGVVTASGTGLDVDITIATGNVKLKTSTDSAGAFGILLPPADYTFTTSTTMTENGASISYSGSKKVSVDKTDVYVDFELTRDTRYGVSTSWNKSLMPTAAPGVVVTYVFQVTNTGNIEDSYTMSFTGKATDFTVKFPSSSVTVGSGSGRNQANVEVQVNASNALSAGESKVVIQVRSKASSSTRSEVSLYLNTAVVKSVLVVDLGPSKAVNSLSSYTKFSLNNTGNAQDNFALNITNLDALEALGWTAEIVDQDTGNVVPSVGMPAFHATPILVKFTAIRANPDPNAEAVVLAYSTNDPGVNYYGVIPVYLPDLSIDQPDLTAARYDISYTFDASIVAIDLILVAAVAVLAVGIFYLRRKKGLGAKGKGKGKTGGGTK